MHLVKHIITSEWVQTQGLKHLFASFHNIGVFLYRNKQVIEVFIIIIIIIYSFVFFECLLMFFPHICFKFVCVKFGAALSFCGDRNTVILGSVDFFLLLSTGVFL